MIDQNQQPQEQELSASELAGLSSAEVAQPAVAEEGKTPEVPLYGDIPEDKFWGALPIATGGKVTDRTTFQQVLERNEKYPHLESKVRELEAKANIVPFATPLVENVNKLVAEGVAPDKLLSYVKLAVTDTSTMSPYDLLKTQLKFDPIGYTKPQIAALIEEKYGITADTNINDLSPLQAAQLKQAVVLAKQDLDSRRVAYEQSYQPSEQVLAQQAKNADIIGRWEAALPEIKPDLSFKYEDKENGSDPYEFKYSPPSEVVDQARAIVMNAIRTNPDQFPPTKSGHQAAQQLLNKMVMLGAAEDYRVAMYRDVVAKAKQAAALDKAGPIPNRQTPPPVAAPNEKKSLMLSDAFL